MITTWQRPRCCCVVVAFLLVLLTGGCADVGAEMIDVAVPHSDFHLVADEAYGELPRQKLDIYQPVIGAKPWPVVVFVSPITGAFDTQDKSDYLFVGEALASRGFLVVIPGFRVMPEAPYPVFVQDNAAAFHWTLSHIAQFGGDPQRVFLMGHSAGAYIAAMLALDGRWLGPDRARIKATVCLSGPFDFMPTTDPLLKAVFRNAQDPLSTQPLTYADGTARPMLLMTGLDDQEGTAAGARKLAARIRAHGGVVEEHYYPGVGHYAVIAALAKPLRFYAPVLKDVTAYLDREAASPRAPPP